MAIKNHKPTSPGRRFVTHLDFEEVTRSTPEKKLTEGKKRSSGRNSDGHITVRHRGRGHKQRYRIIDFKRDKFDAILRGWVALQVNQLDRLGFLLLDLFNFRGILDSFGWQCICHIE